MNHAAIDRGQEVVRLCADLGFARAGVCEAAPSERPDELIRWLKAGKHGSMAWLENHLGKRLDPRLLLEGARSMILVTDQYGARDGGAVDAPGPARTGRIARYARGDDYHKVIKKRLHALCDALHERHPGERFKAFTDTAPVLEREHAARAGLGWVAKHTLLIDPEKGSWLLLGGVLTSLELAPPPQQRSIEDHCGACTRCIEACPTDAISPYSVDATKCISYLTIEHRERIDPSFHESMGDWIFGCDICQEVCPHNSPRGGDAKRRGEIREEYGQRRDSFDLLDVLGWTEDDRRDAFTKSAMKRAKLDMMKRNALIVAGNAFLESNDPALRARIEELAADESEPPLVRETARETLDRIARD